MFHRPHVYASCCLALALAAAPTSAYAASCFAPGQLTASIPGSGGTLARNDAIYLTGRNLSLDSVSAMNQLGSSYQLVTIATLGPRLGEDGETVVVVLEPQPEIGEQITVAGNFCSDGDEACDFDLRVTIADDDPEVLLPPTDLPAESAWTSTELGSASDCPGDEAAGGCAIDGPSSIGGVLGMVLLGLRRRRR